MTLQVINVGSAPNDGLGDPIRTAYIKCNDNFGELYSRAQASPPVTLAGSPGDKAGMYAYNDNFWYYCYADYDTSSVIWAQVAQIGNISVSGIQSGNSDAQFDDIDGNLVISISNTSNVAEFRTDGLFVNSNITAGNVNATNFYGTVGTAAQPSITSVGTLTSLGLGGLLTSTANISTTGNVIGGNLVTTGLVQSSRVSASGNIWTEDLIGNTTITTPGTISATGNITTNGYFIGTFFGNVTGNFVVPGSSTQVLFNSSGNADASSNFTFNKVTNVLQVNGNVSSFNVVTGSAYASGVISAGGNVTGGNLVTAGLVNSTGNINGGNLRTAGQVSATGNVTGGNITTGGQVSATGNINGGNVITGTISATGNVSVSGNVTGGNLVGGGVSAVGSIVGAVIRATSTVSAVGNITGGNVISLGNIAGTYFLGNGSLLTGVITTVTNVVSGNSNVDISSAAANVTVSVNGVANVGVFSDAGLAITGAITGSSLGTGTGNITGGNAIITTAITATTLGTTGNVSGGNLTTGGQVVATGNVSGGNILTAGAISATGNIDGGNIITSAIQGTSLTVGTGSITVGGIINANANGVGNIGDSSTYFNTAFVKATSAQYADLAEKYTADAEYLPGTVVVFGGTNEVTESTISGDSAVAGVISTNPAYTMNSGLDGEFVATVALVGRVPCQVIGPIRKGALLVSAPQGRAQASASPQVGTVVGKALENFDGDQGVIEIVVGKL
jgi:hypothetical protein